MSISRKFNHLPKESEKMTMKLSKLMYRAGKSAVWVLALIMILSAVTGCALSPTGPHKGDANETETGKQTSSAENTTDSKPAESEKGLTMNDAFFAEIGMSYRELSQKYGDVLDTEADIGGGGIAYQFSKSGNRYCWPFDSLKYADGTNTLPRKTDGSIDYKNAPLPNDDAVCTSAEANTPESLFKNAEFPISVQSVKNAVGSAVSTNKDDQKAISDYVTVFDYMNVRVYLHHSDESSIDNNTIFFAKNLTEEEIN